MNPRLRARFERMKEAESRMSKELKDSLKALLPEGQVLFDEPMQKHSSIGIGGPAESFVICETIEELKKVMAWVEEYNVECKFWGAGSNTLVLDGGIKGVVITLGSGFDSIEVEREDGDDVMVFAGTSTPTAKLVRFATEKGFSGLEGLAGCYGNVGGNIFTNAGTPFGTIGDVVEEVTIVNREGRELSMKKSSLKFEYRSVRIPRTAAIVRALFRLKKSTPEEVAGRVDEILKKRDDTQPKGVRSLGCIFKNVGKMSAGMLVDEAGLKGVRVGGARVSPVHANFIVNEGKATARDVKVLINLVRERVKEHSGVVLETEIEIVGE